MKPSMDRSPGRITSAGLTLCNQEYCVIARPHNSRTDNPPCLRPRLRVGGYPLRCLVFVPSIRQNCDRASSASRKRTMPLVGLPFLHPFRPRILKKRQRATPPNLHNPTSWPARTPLIDSPAAAIDLVRNRSQCGSHLATASVVPKSSAVAPR